MKDDAGENDYGLVTYLYADTAFSTWAAKAADATNSPTENEKAFVDQYSDYTLKIDCNLKMVAKFDSTTNRASSSCCLRDKSAGKGGGYCMKLGSA